MSGGFTIVDQSEFIKMNTRIPATVITGFLGSGKNHADSSISSAMLLANVWH
jgi:hypothetical protein